MYTETAFGTIEESWVLSSYFQAINSKNYGLAAALFCQDGVLIAPLGVWVEGREAIAIYLEQKCDGMQLLPEHCTIGDEVRVVVGSVRSPAFSVNVEWTFQIAEDGIRRLQVRLLASLKDLVHLRDSYQA